MKADFLLRSTPAPTPLCSWAAIRLMCSLLLPLAATGAAAQSTSSDEPTWICWYIRGTQAHCRLGRDISASPSRAVPSSPAAAQRTDVPTGRRSLPEIVRTILAEPEKLAGRIISIPLFTESGDRDFVRELAEAVMCGAKNMCSVLLLDSPTEIALTMDALEDPALN